MPSMLPNQARYQLRYTRIFNFCHYTTAGEKIKDFSVCGHLCGQSRFCTAFGNRRKSSKRRCRKALRRFALPCPGYRHGTPKPPALPAALHPDIFGFCRRRTGGDFSTVRSVPAADKGTCTFYLPTMPRVPNDAIIPLGGRDVKFAFFRTGLSWRIREWSAIC